MWGDKTRSLDLDRIIMSDNHIILHRKWALSRTLPGNWVGKAVLFGSSGEAGGLQINTDSKEYYIYIRMWCFLNNFYLFSFLAVLGLLHCCAGFPLGAEGGATLCCSVRTSYCGGFSCRGARTPGRTDSLAVVHGLSCSACGTLPDQRLSLRLLHWQVDSSALSLQGSPECNSWVLFLWKEKDADHWKERTILLCSFACGMQSGRYTQVLTHASCQFSPQGRCNDHLLNSAGQVAVGDSLGTGSQVGLSRTGSSVSFEFKGDTQERERILPDLSTLCSDVDTACSATVVFLAFLMVCSSVPLGKLSTSDKKRSLLTFFWLRQSSVWQLGSTGFASILPIPKGFFFFFLFLTVNWTDTSCCIQTQSLPLIEWKNRLIQSDLDHQPRLNAWHKCSDLVHWEDPEESGGEGGGRRDRDGEYM